MKSEYTKQWILDTGIPIVESYYGNLTLRALHYRLVAAGMINDTNHYKKVVSAKWDGLGQVELDAVEPPQIVELCNDAIESVFDDELYDELKDQEKEERNEFKAILRRDFETLLD